VNAPDTTVCFHCGEALPAPPVNQVVAGILRRFCCNGCSAAASWIEEADLGDYYRLRSEASARVDADADTADLSIWDREDVIASHVRNVPGGREITVLTDGMRCAACAWLIDRALQRQPGVLDAGANAITGRIRIAWDPVRIRLSALLSTLATLGYRPYLAAGEASERLRRSERNRWLIRLGLAGLGAMQAMMLAEALYLDTHHQMSVPTRDFFRWITFLVSTPVVFYAGWPFLAGMANEWRGRRLGMDTLIASATLLAYFASLIETIRGGPHVWYDAAVMFVFLLLVARMLEQRGRNIASAQVDALARARPTLATRERDDGKLEQVPVAALKHGDIVRVAAGEALPADGTALDHAIAVDESLLTGEATPVIKACGDNVFAGSYCRDATARVRITSTGAETRLSQLTRLVERAQAERPALARTSDRIASWFVTGLLLVAIAVYFSWRLYAPERAFEVLLALLVVSCPCALSLAIPAALAAAHGTLARMGVLALRPGALETLAKIDCIVFDKTGTLSDGCPEIERVDLRGDLSADEVLQIAAALEQDSRHPIARAFIGITPDQPAAQTRAISGRGVSGIVNGREWRLGRTSFAANAEDDDQAVWLGDGERAWARIVLREHARADATRAIDELRQKRLGVELCSGDAASAVERFANAFGIEHPLARQTPEQKLAHARALQANGHVVAMVGDGLNDAPVLAGADVSLAMADGAALAQRAADFVITGGSLRRVPQAIDLAIRTRRVIQQNLAWAIAYNLLALPLAAAGRVTPWIAALGMALSSLLVTLNALRLTREVRA
jgi:P-type Cu2+ transporter